MAVGAVRVDMVPLVVDMVAAMEDVAWAVAG